MEPQVRYVRSSDGTKIAIASLGTGEPIVVSPATVGFIDAYLGVPESRGAIEELATNHRVLIYDQRGRGLSDRVVTDWSLKARVDDLLAVFDGMSITSACLLGRALGSPAAIAFAALHPERVRRLGLYAGVARGADIHVDAVNMLLTPVAETRWDLFCQFFSLMIFGWTESGKVFADLMHNATSRDSMQEYIAAAQADDVSDYLERVQCPTLLVHPARGAAIVPPEAMRELAARIPDALARTSDFEAWSSLLLGEDDVRAFEAFFDAEEPAAVSQASIGGITAILFADIAGSTALTERLGDAAFRERARELDAALRAVIRGIGGTPIEGKLLGDGVLATFTSARQAIEAALACARSGDDAGLPLHLGLHAGDVIREDNNVYGGAVNIASRISGLSASGEVLASETVRSLARTSAGVSFEDRGEQELKGVGEAVRVWAVREGE